ncbi:MAG TPA: hypothetical protein VGT07_01390 [Steroidobacteraceae bacterium]|nr:hypothetical protein [Steroidobacteraceae bacterium]
MIRDRGLRHWLPTYLWETLRRREARAARRRGVTHILFLVCDHFEPRHGISDERQPAARLRAWHAGFKELQQECFARYGLRPVHTWFYPPHHGDDHLSALARMAFEGLGEVELHYHHDGDTAETLREALRQTLARYHSAGLLTQLGDPPGRRFGFIHGDWALDNSAGGRFCGVNDELSLLEGLGCWADLTMPSTNECQTRKINSIYYAVGDPRRSKSHDWGVDARAGNSGARGLMLIQGPIALRFDGGLRPRVENASLTSNNWGSPARIRSWIDCHVHVRGRPEWLFVKLHTHGAIESDFDALFGERARRMHRALAEQYNDGRIFRIHYVTARQAYNLARAAESGAEGDPAAFLDFEVPPQATSVYWTNAAHRAVSCTGARLTLEGMESAESTVVELRHAGIESVSGRVRALDLAADRALIRLHPDGIRLRLSEGTRIAGLSSGRILRESSAGELLLGGSSEIAVTLGAVDRAAGAK